MIQQIGTTCPWCSARAKSDGWFSSRKPLFQVALKMRGWRDCSMELTASPAPSLARGEYGRVDPDRRRRIRSHVHWTVLFRDDPVAIVETVTQNLSCDGFYCLAATLFNLGDTRVCTLQIPAPGPEDLNRVLVLECRVLVVRVDVLSERLFGIACRIDEYRVSVVPDYRLKSTRKT
jgi:hypothetical protein